MFHGDGTEYCIIASFQQHYHSAFIRARFLLSTSDEVLSNQMHNIRYLAKI